MQIMSAPASAGEKYFAAITSSPSQRSVRRRLPDQLGHRYMRFINLSRAASVLREIKNYCQNPQLVVV